MPPDTWPGFRRRVVEAFFQFSSCSAGRSVCAAATGDQKDHCGRNGQQTEFFHNSDFVIGLICLCVVLSFDRIPDNAKIL
jgi:hypothetical protein